LRTTIRTKTTSPSWSAATSSEPQLEQAWGIYHALIARADFRKEKEAVPV
jgi:hypothetical protein